MSVELEIIKNLQYDQKHGNERFATTIMPSELFISSIFCNRRAARLLILEALLSFLKSGHLNQTCKRWPRAMVHERSLDGQFDTTKRRWREAVKLTSRDNMERHSSFCLTGSEYYWSTDEIESEGRRDAWTLSRV